MSACAASSAWEYSFRVAARAKTEAQSCTTSMLVHALRLTGWITTAHPVMQLLSDGEIWLPDRSILVLDSSQHEHDWVSHEAQHSTTAYWPLISGSARKAWSSTRHGHVHDTCECLLAGLPLG